MTSSMIKFIFVLTKFVVYITGNRWEALRNRETQLQNGGLCGLTTAVEPRRRSSITTIWFKGIQGMKHFLSKR